MPTRSIDIVLSKDEAGGGIEMLYENACTLKTEPEISFNYATTEELKAWGFTDGCFACFLMDKKDVIIQAITAFQYEEGATSAFNADVDFLRKNDYGDAVASKEIGETSVLFKKKQSDGITYNLLFLKNNIFAAISAKYKVDRPDKLANLMELAEKIERKIQGRSC